MYNGERFEPRNDSCCVFRLSGWEKSCKSQLKLYQRSGINPVYDYPKAPTIGPYSIHCISLCSVTRLANWARPYRNFQCTREKNNSFSEKSFVEIERWDWNVLVMWCHDNFQFQLFFCVVVPDHDLVVNQNSYSSLHIVCLFAFLISLFMHGRMKELFVVSGREKRRWRENLSWSWKPFVKILLIEFLAKKGYLRHIPKKKNCSNYIFHHC